MASASASASVAVAVAGEGDCGGAQRAAAFDEKWSNYLTRSGFFHFDPEGMKGCIADVRDLLEKDGFFLQREREYLTSLLGLMEEMHSAFLLREEILGGEQVPVLLPTHNVSMDFKRIAEKYPGFEPPQTGQLEVLRARFTASPHLFFSNQDWGDKNDSVQTVLDFLKQLPDTLVESVKIFFPDAGQRVDFAPLIAVLKNWKNLSEFTFLCLQNTTIPEEAQELLLALQPRRLNLHGCRGFQVLRRINEFENLEELSMLLVQEEGGRIPESVSYLWNKLPRTVSKVSLTMGTYPGDVICNDLNDCLDALPEHVTKLGLNGFRIWHNQANLQRVFGANRFEELRIFNSETTSLSVRGGKWSYLLDQELPHCSALKVLRTDKLSASIAKIIRLCDLEELSYTTPFRTDNAFDADKGRAIGAIIDSRIKKIKYEGLVSTTKDTLDLQNLIQQRGPSALQRARAVIFANEVLKKRCAEGAVTDLGAIPMHVLVSGIEHCAALTVDDKNKRKQLEEDAEADFFRTMELAEELDWFEKQPKLRDQYDSIVKVLQHQSHNWYTAVTSLTEFLFHYGAARKKRCLMRQIMTEERTAREQKRALENPSENERDGKREMVADEQSARKQKRAPEDPSENERDGKRERKE